MKRAIKSRFKCSREDLNRLFACNRISALIWNKILDLQREKFRSKGELQKALKGLYPINSQSVQAVTDKYCAACLATKSAGDNGLKNKYPWRRKCNYPTTWKADSFKLKGNRLKLSLGTFAGKRQQPIEIKLPNSTLKTLEGVKLQQISLIWDGRLKLAIVIDDGKENAPAIQSDVTCGIDLGEIHSIAAFESGGKAIIITGRLLRSVKQYQLKKLAEFGRKLSKCKINSRRYKKLRRAKRRMLQKTNARSSRNYRCSCGYSAHRDIHGARNILSLGLNGRIFITTPIKEKKYLRTA